MTGQSLLGRAACRLGLDRFFARVVVVVFGTVPSVRHKIQRSFLVPPAALSCRSRDL